MKLLKVGSITHIHGRCASTFALSERKSYFRQGINVFIYNGSPLDVNCSICETTMDKEERQAKEKYAAIVAEMSANELIAWQYVEAYINWQIEDFSGKIALD